MQAQQAEAKDSFFSVGNNNIPNKKHLYTQHEKILHSYWLFTFKINKAKVGQIKKGKLY